MCAEEVVGAGIGIVGEGPEPIEAVKDDMVTSGGGACERLRSACLGCGQALVVGMNLRHLKLR